MKYFFVGSDVLVLEDQLKKKETKQKEHASSLTL